jgi:hypothetical protein
MTVEWPKHHIWHSLPMQRKHCKFILISVSNEGHFTLEAESVFCPYLASHFRGWFKLQNLQCLPMLHKDCMFGQIRWVKKGTLLTGQSSLALPSCTVNTWKLFRGGLNFVLLSHADNTNYSIGAEQRSQYHAPATLNLFQGSCNLVQLPCMRKTKLRRESLPLSFEQQSLVWRFDGHHHTSRSSNRPIKPIRGDIVWCLYFTTTLQESHSTTCIILQNINMC